MDLAASLVSTMNHVESPFIIVKIGNYTFGHCEKTYRNRLQTQFSVTYPNFMESLTVTKVNGAINTYSINMIYAVTQTDDPNMLDKVFSSVSNTRMITLSYGDWNMPGFIYKDEEAVITKVSTKVNMQSSTINYTIQCTSTSVNLRAGSLSFPARRAKPSDVIISMLNNEHYGLKTIFKGMRNNKDFSKFIARDDKEVQLEARTSCSILDYISYLVSCMVHVNDPDKGLKSSCYFWSVYDDINNTYGGTYFKVIRTTANSGIKSYNTYEIDVGYPTPECVIDFTVNNDESWSLLYNYSKDIAIPQSTYTIDDSGSIVIDDSESATKSSLLLTTTEAQRNWWSLVTQYPITASLTIKGLLRPAMLMSYVKINTYFYGHKHISSGVYLITKQVDTINSSGYRTTLSLTRVAGD